MLLAASSDSLELKIPAATMAGQTLSETSGANPVPAFVFCISQTLTRAIYLQQSEDDVLLVVPQNTSCCHRIVTTDFVATPYSVRVQ